MKGKENYHIGKEIKNEVSTRNDDIPSDIGEMSRTSYELFVIVKEAFEEVRKDMREDFARERMLRENRNKSYVHNKAPEMPETNEIIVTTYVEPLSTETKRENEKRINGSYNNLTKLPEESEIMYR